MERTTTVQARLVVDLTELLGNDTFAGVSLDYDANPLVVSHHQAERDVSTLAIWARELGIPRNSTLRVSFMKDGDWVSTDLQSQPEYPRVQRVSQDRWLVVGDSAFEPMHNAAIFANTGELLSDFHAGSSVADVQATRDGQVWVSNHDEKNADDSELSEGLVCLDLQGRPIFRYSSVVDAADLSIFDCYALNVVSDKETWLCFYTEFPLVRIVDHEIAGVWRELAPPGSHAFAVHEYHALFSPGYSRERAMTLVDTATSSRRKFRIIAPDGQRLRTERSSIARGSKMYVVDARKLFVIDLADF